MNDMFFGCESLETLDISEWNVSNVKDMEDILKVKRDVLSLEPANQRFVLNPVSISI